MKPSEVLKKFDWTKHANARDNTKLPVAVSDESACSFCALGAVKKSHYRFFNEFLSIMDLYVIHCSLTQYNDTVATSKEEMIEILEKAEIIYEIKYPNEQLH